MGYTMLKNSGTPKNYPAFSLEGSALKFIRESCEGLRFDTNKATVILDKKAEELDFDGTSLRANQIPFNMEKDIDRLSFENAINRFLKSGKKEDAFNVYFCYLEMFVGDYEKTRKMIELLSEFEANGSGLLMKHRDHYSHSVYVFCLGLAIYETNTIYRETYKTYYGIEDEHQAAYHYLQYWGLTSLFHDIGYPFELPFEQVCSYFEVDGNKRSERPFVAYHALDSFVTIQETIREKLKTITHGRDCSTTNELFASVLTEKLGNVYGFTEEQMLTFLIEKPTKPEAFNHFMDHAYFSATILFKKLFEEMNCELTSSHLDALTAILMHNSLYKFCIAHYKSAGNKPFQAKLHPLAYMLMLCDELQCWDRTAYGRNSKKELHPMGCTFDFSGNAIKAVYLYDEREIGKINSFKDRYIEWLQAPEGKAPALKAYSGMYIKKNGISSFQKDIESIVDLTEIKLYVETGLTEYAHTGKSNFLSDSTFISLYHFAMILNGRWNNADWKKAKSAGQEEKFLSNDTAIHQFTESFKKLSLEYKLYNINQAKAFAKYMDEIGCFYTDKSVDFELVESFSSEELLKIGRMEHQRWLQEHYDMGWTFGTPAKNERDFLREHKDMIPQFHGQLEVSADAAQANYDRLDLAEQDKDTDPMECMLAMLKLFDGLRIYRLH
ncbi:MAG: hypothetical protein Q4E24_08415 [bacterium]|nr:hypothetical protein [bacterium]